MTSPVPPTPRARLPALPAALLAALVACSTPPQPQPVASPPRVLVEVTPPPARPAPVPEPAASAPVASATVPATSPSSPYSAAVAARFPDPLVRYDTPAFAAGHTGFTSNAELQTLLRGLARDGRGAAAATQVRLLALGSSQSGVPLEALLFTRLAETAPAELLASGRPTVLLVGQQHGNEPAGSEALIVLAQQLARGRLEALLDRINVLILPRANPDGAAADRRETASGIDANRDHLLLRTPEAQAQAALLRDYRPVVVVDAHEFSVGGRYLEKFGALQRADALLQYATTANLPEFMTRAAEEWFRRPILASLKREGLSSDWYYTTSLDADDKRVAMGGTRPDTARNVQGLANTVSLLIETRGVGLGRQHLARRVHTQVVAMTTVLESAATRADDLVKLRTYVDNEVSALACQGDAVVEAGPTQSEYDLVLIDSVTGADKKVTVTWESALQLQVLKSRARPCGYWLAADQQDAVRHLRALGVQVRRVDEMGVMRGETYQELSREIAARQDARGNIADGAGVVLVKVQTVPTLVDAPAGSWYVPLDQPLANLVIAALEPDTQNSFLASGVVAGVASLARVLARPDVRTSVIP